MSLLPPRFRPEAVTRYWPHIQAMLDSWPTPIKVNPHPLAVDTFTCRFRDAVQAILKHGQGTQAQYSALNGLGHLIMVKPTKDGILIGPKDEIKRLFKHPASTPVGHVIDAKVTLTDSPIISPSQMVLTSIFVLLEHGIIEHITIDGVDEKVLMSFISKCNRPLELLHSTKTAFTIF